MLKTYSTFANHRGKSKCTMDKRRSGGFKKWHSIAELTKTSLSTTTMGEGERQHVQYFPADLTNI